jgi:putative PIN family toxin of toxin-antitoxin system
MVSPGGANGCLLRNIAAGLIDHVVSDEIEAEYFHTLERPALLRLIERKGASIDECETILTAFCTSSERVRPIGEAPVCRDEHDRKYLHCAVTARSDYLVTHDPDLLVLGTVEGIPVVTPGRLLNRLRGEKVTLVD